MLIDRIPGHRVEEHKPAPRVVVSSETWRMLAGELAAGRVTLFGLWATPIRCTWRSWRKPRSSS
jgi:hypothetical protein